MNPGPVKGKVVFSFEDPSGEEFTYEREFSLNAIEMPPMEFPTGEMPMPPMSTKDKIMKYTKNWFSGLVLQLSLPGSLQQGG